MQRDCDLHAVAKKIPQRAARRLGQHSAVRAAAKGQRKIAHRPRAKAFEPAKGNVSRSVRQPKKPGNHQPWDNLYRSAVRRDVTKCANLRYFSPCRKSAALACGRCAWDRSRGLKIKKFPQLSSLHSRSGGPPRFLLAALYDSKMAPP